MHLRFSSRCRYRLMGAALSFTWGCAASPAAPSAIGNGVWGGQHVALTVSDAASHLEFDCAHGEIPLAFTVDGQRAFDLTGTFVREHGGPIREGETADVHPAEYRGTVTDNRMTLTLVLKDTRETIGTFTLIRGAPGQVFKCL